MLLEAMSLAVALGHADESTVLSWPLAKFDRWRAFYRIGAQSGDQG